MHFPQRHFFTKELSKPLRGSCDRRLRKHNLEVVNPLAIEIEMNTINQVCAHNVHRTPIVPRSAWSLFRILMWRMKQRGYGLDKWTVAVPLLLRTLSRYVHNWKAGASQPSRTNDTIFLYIHIIVNSDAFTHWPRI